MRGLSSCLTFPLSQEPLSSSSRSHIYEIDIGNKNNKFPSLNFSIEPVTAATPAPYKPITQKFNVNNQLDEHQRQYLPPVNRNYLPPVKRDYLPPFTTTTAAPAISILDLLSYSQPSKTYLPAKGFVPPPQNYGTY